MSQILLVHRKAEDVDNFSHFVPLFDRIAEERLTQEQEQIERCMGRTPQESTADDMEFVSMLTRMLMSDDWAVVSEVLRLSGRRIIIARSEYPDRKYPHAFSVCIDAGGLCTFEEIVYQRRRDFYAPSPRWTRFKSDGPTWVGQVQRKCSFSTPRELREEIYEQANIIYYQLWKK